MELPAIGSADRGLATPGQNPVSLATLQASSVASLDLPAGAAEPLSISISNQVEMFFAHISQGGLDEQTLKALILLLVIQLILNEGFNDQTQKVLDGLLETFKSAGNTDMTFVAMKASSMVQIDLGGAGKQSPSPEGGLDIIA